MKQKTSVSVLRFQQHVELLSSVTALPTNVQYFMQLKGTKRLDETQICHNVAQDYDKYVQTLELATINKSLCQHVDRHPCLKQEKEEFLDMSKTQNHPKPSNLRFFGMFS